MSDAEFLTLMFVGALLWSAIGAWIGSTKGRTFEGLLLGFLLGLIGVIVVIFLKPTLKFKAEKQAQAYQALATPGSIIGWHVDPYHRHELRYYNGTDWQNDVSDHGVMGKDVLQS